MSIYVPNREGQRQKMLKTIGVEKFQELLSPVPEEVRLTGPLNLPEPADEMELRKEFSDLGNRNTAADLVCFRGAGAYDHFVPAAIDSILQRSEFFTAYTPYQAEVSQGTLQAIYEYQTMIARLTGCDAANAGMYDGASAVAEAALMAVRATGKNRILVSGSLNPRTLAVMHTYMDSAGFEINEIPFTGEGVTDLEAAAKLMEGGAAAIIVQYPNFFGCIEDVRAAADLIHQAKGLMVVAADPVALAVLEAPGAMGADIVTGEGQPMGIPMSYGGPYAGFMAASSRLLRKMPGRIVGKTEDRAGNTGYVLTLQTREQHIKRNKATSNICTNQALMALANTVYLSLTGETGFRTIAEHCWHKTHYLFHRLTALEGVTPVFSAPFFREFAVNLPVSADEAEKALLERGFLPGLPLRGLGENAMLFAVTEKRTAEEIDALVNAVSDISRGSR
ncbi:aminomethyl-transferring glycine dehydrogenase [Candidatus Fermentibacteria bacterium]|nr:MAG: aminomethyl-transferring glycine dehydrogenase [Candidatus Fermentibacteria bacterium]